MPLRAELPLKGRFTSWSRTNDNLIPNQVLYRLSYGKEQPVRLELTTTDVSDALPLSYGRSLLVATPIHTRAIGGCVRSGFEPTPRVKQHHQTPTICKQCAKHKNLIKDLILKNIITFPPRNNRDLSYLF